MIHRLLRPPWLATSPGWWRAFLLGALLCAGAGAAESLPAIPVSPTTWTMAYGIAAAALLCAALAYSVRRRMPRRGPAGAWHWVQLHVYGGALFLLLIVMHTGGRLPGGVLGWAMWLASLWVVATGLLGVFVQKWAPVLLTSGLTTEVHYDRIPELVHTIRERVERLASGGSHAVRRLYDAHVAPALAGPRTRLIYFVDVTGGVQSQMRRFDDLRRFIGNEDAERMAQIQTLLRTKLEIDAHYTVQKALRWWLYAHAPAAPVLVCLVLFHVFSVFRY